MSVQLAAFLLMLMLFRFTVWVVANLAINIVRDLKQRPTSGRGFDVIRLRKP